MDRERLVSDEGPREESEPELFEEEDTEVVSEDLSEFGDESALDEPALDEGAIEERDEAGAEGESEDAEGAPRRRRRRRRRGRRGSGDRSGPREERAPGRPSGAGAPEPRDLSDESEDDDDDEDEEDLDEDSGDLTGESELTAEDEEGDENAPRVYRNVPTWEEAISFLVHKRPEGRRDEGGPREPRRDGGRPR
jgi:hypothetical protein